MFDFFQYLFFSGADPSTSYTGKWVLVDVIYCLCLAQLRIPRLNYPKSVVMLQILSLCLLDAFLFGGITVNLGLGSWGIAVPFGITRMCCTLWFCSRIYIIYSSTESCFYGTIVQHPWLNSRARFLKRPGRSYSWTAYCSHVPNQYCPPQFQLRNILYSGWRSKHPYSRPFEQYQPDQRTIHLNSTRVLGNSRGEREEGFK